MKRLGLLFFLSFSLLGAEDFRFSGDHSFSVMREGAETTTIEGNVVIESDERLIKADNILIRGRNKKIFEGDGNVFIQDYSRNMLIQSDKFTYTEENSSIHVEGNVVLEDRESEVLVKCLMLNFLQEEELAVMQLNVRIFKDDIICRSEYALFRRDEEILELSGAPVVYKGDDRYEADHIIVNLSNDEISMFGDITGSMETEGGTNDSKKEDAALEETTAEDTTTEDTTTEESDE